MTQDKCPHCGAGIDETTGDLKVHKCLTITIKGEVRTQSAYCKGRAEARAELAERLEQINRAALWARRSSLVGERYREEIDTLIDEIRGKESEDVAG